MENILRPLVIYIYVHVKINFYIFFLFKMVKLDLWLCGGSTQSFRRSLPKWPEVSISLGEWPACVCAWGVCGSKSERMTAISFGASSDSRLKSHSEGNKVSLLCFLTTVGNL